MYYEIAEKFLKESAAMNPGPWHEHSHYAGEAARRISGKISGMDDDFAYACGLVHDIGRRYGVTSLKHTIDGYNFLKGTELNSIASVCLTHSFPYPDASHFIGKNDCSREEYDFIDSYLRNNPLTEYDKLIILCDALGGTDGFYIIEERLVDVVIRHGANPAIALKWKGYFEIKKEFENRLGYPIYRLFPELGERLFGSVLKPDYIQNNGGNRNGN